MHASSMKKHARQVEKASSTSSTLRLSVPKWLALHVEGPPHVILAVIVGVVAIATLALCTGLLR
jgi:hypothetical protein